MAQEVITINENGESQEVTGTVITIAEDEEYIDTDTKLYEVIDKNTILLGDVVKDNIINITDVTAMVTMLLDEGYAKVADVNQDKIVNITDVTIEVQNLLDSIYEEIVESYEVEDITDVWIQSKTVSAVDQH